MASKVQSICRLGHPVLVAVAVAALVALAWLPRAAARDSAVIPLAAKYAPVLMFHPGERNFPEDASAYLEKSALYWRHENRCSDRLFAKGGTINARRLGSGRYVHEPGVTDRCRHRYSQRSRSDELTRPFDSRSTTGSDGFYLRYNGPVEGGKQPWPVYVEYKPGRWITYWFFYAFNKPLKVSKVERSRRVSLFGRHQGDWEQIAVQLNGDQAIAAAYYGHGAPRIVPWKDATEGGDRPLVAVALGSHASYPPSFVPATGEQEERNFCISHVGCEVDILSRKGVHWSTWQRMRDVRREPWFGYGGAWGKPARWWTDPIALFGRRDVVTGPLGPSRWKPAAPKSWN